MISRARKTQYQKVWHEVTVRLMKAPEEPAAVSVKPEFLPLQAVAWLHLMAV